MSDLTLKNAFENNKIVPHQDIINDKITENTFAVGFHSVIEKTAPNIYNDPNEYFTHTHFTKNLLNIFELIIYNQNDTNY